MPPKTLREKLEDHKLTFQKPRKIGREEIPRKFKTGKQYASAISEARRRGKILIFKPKLESIAEED